MEIRDRLPFGLIIVGQAVKPSAAYIDIISSIYLAKRTGAVVAQSRHCGQGRIELQRCWQPPR
jgi:hypothetical protein